MSKKNLIGVIVVLLAVIGGLVYAQMNQKTPAEQLADDANKAAEQVSKKVGEMFE